MRPRRPRRFYRSSTLTNKQAEPATPFRLSRSGIDAADMNEQQLIGSVIAVLGGLAGYHHRWLLEQTPKGRRLVGWFGLDRARWVLGAVVLGVVVFGVLLACDVIRPRGG
ncbi:MAG: hypothetical protein CMJ69_07020 [Planctomycetaceae bacterium]|nr:hypothetical protein [Planctomycetaceae bacterium]